MSNLKRLIVVGLVIILLLGGMVTAYGIRGRCYIWLWDYLTASPLRAETSQLTDIIFVVVDHWEPGGSQEIVNTWTKSYRELADRHVDADGVKLRHTWYYPLEQFRGYEVDSLVRLCSEGYGDVEVHLHHRNDDSVSLRKKLVVGIDSLMAHGALRSPDGRVHFSFVHGNWALDNSRWEGGINACGVNSEISILVSLGCYSDCTFPAMGHTAQPALVNKIYYAVDDPAVRKSHNKGPRCAVGGTPPPEALMLMEGPFLIDWSDWRFKFHPTFEDGDLYWEIPTTLHRFETWLAAGVHVKGRPNWVFVRPFMHGAALGHDGAYDNILGKNIDEMLSAVERKYNDGSRYRLHYMTAREAYNVAKAAEAGYDGNPSDYRDFVLKAYLYGQRN